MSNVEAFMCNVEAVKGNVVAVLRQEMEYLLMEELAVYMTTKIK